MSKTSLTMLSVFLGLSLFSAIIAQAQEPQLNVEVSSATGQAVLEVVKTWHDTPVVAATPTPTSAATPTPTLIPALEAINDWHYQLQNINLSQLRDSAYDLLVIDHANDDGDPFSAGQIQDLSTQSNPKIVLAYMSIGEAEDYRYYWSPSWSVGSPSFIDSENPDWAGNYAVRYWLSEWREVLVDGSNDYLSLIMNQGFDGVYLDKLDEYEFFEEKVNTDSVFRAQFGTVDFKKEMVALVKHIADTAHAVNPNFLIIGQNGLPLWHEEDFEASVDGMDAEEVYFVDGEARPEEEVNEREGYLRLFRRSGNIALVVDYLASAEVLKISDVYEKSLSADNDFVPFVTGVDLDEFRVNKGQDPD